MQDLKEYFQRYNELVAHETKFCTKNAIDLIISDIEPVPFEAGAKCGIKTIAITNFTWHDIFQSILPAESRHLSILKRAYEKCTLLLRIPFHFDMPYFHECIDVPLVFKRATRTVEAIRTTLNLKTHDKLVFIQFGGHKSHHLKAWGQKLAQISRKNPNIVFLTTSFSEPPSSESLPIKVISSKEVEIQDYVAACDLLVGKTGYSLVSESLGFDRPFFYTIRDHWGEDLLLKKGIEKFGRGKFYVRDQMALGEWIGDLPEGLRLGSSPPEHRIPKFGQNQIVKIMMKRFM
jgi:L-arabinokinase